MASREEKKVPRRLRRFYRKKKTLEKSFAQQPDLESMKEIAKFEKIVKGGKAEGREKESQGKGGEYKGLGRGAVESAGEERRRYASEREKERERYARERQSVESERERQEDISRDIYEEVGRAGSRYGEGQQEEGREGKGHEAEGKDAEGRLRDSTKEKADNEVEKFKRTHSRLPRGREFDDIAGNIYEQVKNEYRQEQPEAVKGRIRHHIRESRVRAEGREAGKERAGLREVSEPAGGSDGEGPAESVKERVERLRAGRREGRGAGAGARAGGAGQVVKKDVFESSAVKGMSVEELFGRQKAIGKEEGEKEGEEREKGTKKIEDKKGAGRDKKKKSELEELEEIASGEGFEEEE